MKCSSCGYEFSGNFCPKCGATAHQEPKSSPAPEQNPVEANLENQNPYEGSCNPAPQQPQQPVNQYAPPGQYPQDAGQGNCYQAPPQPGQPYAYNQYNQQYLHQYTPAPPKKGMSGGKLAVLIICVILAVSLVCFALPVGCGVCIAMIAEDTAEDIVDDARYTVGDSVALGDFALTLCNVQYGDSYKGVEAGDGNTYMTATVEMVNTSDDRRENPSLEFTCYADSLMVEDESNNYGEYYSMREIDPGKTIRVTLVYQVPTEAEDVTLGVYADYLNKWDSYVEKEFTYTVKD